MTGQRRWFSRAGVGAVRVIGRVGALGAYVPIRHAAHLATDEIPSAFPICKLQTGSTEALG